MWLAGDTALLFCTEILDLLKHQHSENEILDRLRDDLDGFASNQIADWNAQVQNLCEVTAEWKELRDRTDKKSVDLARKRDKARFAIISELRKIRTIKLHDALAKASILPIYGFPIDVVQLLTQRNDQHLWGSGGHRLQRDRRLALTEYAPGQDVVVDDRVHRSVAVVRPCDLKKRYYWVCDNCSHFQTKETASEIESYLENDDGDQMSYMPG